MKRFKVSIAETRKRTLLIPADSVDDAISSVEKMYHKSLIKLTADNDVIGHSTMLEAESPIPLPDIIYGDIRVDANEGRWRRCKVDTKTKEVYGFRIPENADTDELLLWLCDGMFKVYPENMEGAGYYWTKVKQIKGGEKAC